MLQNRKHNSGGYNIQFTMRELGEQIKDLRTQKELTLQELSKQIYGTENYASVISKIERNLNQGVTFNTVDKIVKYLGINLVSLLIEKNNKMQENIVSSDLIESTNTFINLSKVDPKTPFLNNKVHQQLLVKRQSREMITNGLNVFRNTGKIPDNISGYQLKILKDIIEIQNEKP
jgi:transcriptional regulator with XRE-family HTH domain